MLTDDNDENYDDGFILTCFKNRFPEYFKNDDDVDMSDAELKNDCNDSLPSSISVPSDDVSEITQKLHITIKTFMFQKVPIILQPPISVQFLTFL